MNLPLPIVAPRESFSHDAPFIGRALGIVVIAVVFAAFTVTAVPVIEASATGRNAFQDDAFYYLVTANHFLSSGRFAFDGVTSTNGFQPLWMALVVLITWVFDLSGAPERQIFAVTLLEQGCLLLGLGIAVRGFLRGHAVGSAWAPAYLGLCIFMLFPPYFIFRQGMETTLAIALLVLALYWYDTGRRQAMGFALAALFLTRLDAGVFVAAPLLLWSEWCTPRTARSLKPALPFIVVFVVYAVANLATTGRIVPISGLIKSSFPTLRFQPGFIVEDFNIARMFGWQALAHGINLTVCLVLNAIGLGMVLFKQARRRMLLGVGAIAVLLASNLLLFQKWDKSIDPRYLALPIAASLFFVVAATNSALARMRGSVRQMLILRARSNRYAVVATFLAALILEAAVGMQDWTTRAKRTDPIRDLFLDVRAALPKGSVLAGTDVGALAFWSGFRVVNLDGVISDFRYQQYLRDGRLADYLHEQGVTHLATGLWDREQSFTGRPVEPMYRHMIDAHAAHDERYGAHQYYVYSYVFDVYSDSVPLYQADEVFRRALGKDGIADASYVVYRLR